MCIGLGIYVCKVIRIFILLYNIVDNIELEYLVIMC